MHRTNVALIGYMGAGKSTVGRELAVRLGKSLLDTDALVEQRAGMSIADIFGRYGEAHFRELEADVVRDVAGKSDAVIACGGGAVLRSDSVEALKSSSAVVFLDVSPKTVLHRLGGGSNVRPLLTGPNREQRVSEGMEKRRPIYVGVADLIVSTDGLSVAAVVDIVEERLSLL